MNTIGLGNALVDVLLKLENDDVLAEVGIQKGAMDMINQEQMIKIRKSQEGLERSQAPGGSVCNTMRAMAILGAKAGFIGKIGSDSVGEYYEEALKKANVSPYFAKTDGISGSCTVLISPDGERTMGTFLGPAPTITPDEITEEMLSAYQCIYIEGYLLVNEELVRTTMQKAKKLGLKVALDLSNFNIVNAFRGLLDDIIPEYVDILFLQRKRSGSLYRAESTRSGQGPFRTGRDFFSHFRKRRRSGGKQGTGYRCSGGRRQTGRHDGSRRPLCRRIPLRAVDRRDIGAVGTYRIAFGRLHN